MTTTRAKKKVVAKKKTAAKPPVFQQTLQPAIKTTMVYQKCERCGDKLFSAPMVKRGHEYEEELVCFDCGKGNK